MVHEVLSARGLVVRLGGRRAIDGLDLSVPAGSVYALLGGNGAGKTTTLNALLGFVVPTAGSVQVDGLDPIRDAAAARLRLAYLPENVALYPYLSGIENLQYFCALGGVRLADAAASALLDQAGLQGPSHTARVATYSKGMRQKVGLAIAHAKHAKAMLLDEPTSGLDPGAANDFAQRVRAAADAGMAVLMATHDLFNAKQVADRIGIMKEGRLVAEFDTHTVSHDDLERSYLVYTRAAPPRSDA
ncbi:ABC transporter ATP-binding protein [Variovorax sp. MHTC-1]|uniref:ABC transporter ATP-binding protein n=1 Tax=Variovorax sp. MHTC-1 TaxID=2495593 RepID=UPI000F85CC8E|nr:ABC transporter ATP-binding protein [Variovorax sp. MHTC-1]RST50402.1 ABC transporter ATP-binding protein [Variovorax sp. MHTC-1]